MTDYNKIDMTGIAPEGEQKQLPIGSYISRIERTERKFAKDKFDEHNQPMPGNGKNELLQIDFKIWAGPEQGNVEKNYLNIWHLDKKTSDIAKSRLLSINIATKTEPGTFGIELWGKWLVIEVYLGRDGKTLRSKFEPCPAHFIPADVPPVEQPPLGTVIAHVPAPAHAPAPAAHVQQHVTAPAAADPNAVPEWARPK